MPTSYGRIKSITAPLQRAPDGSRISGYASAPDIDAYRDRLPPAAFAKHMGRFRQNPIMLANHDATKPVGKFDVVELDNNGLRVGGTIGSGWRAADEARAMVRAGVLKALSVGFREIRPGSTDKEGIYTF